MNISTDEPNINVMPINKNDVNIVSSINDMNKEKKSSVCRICRRKLTLCDITCRCGETFCGKHRHSFQHGCTFDYKGENQKLLEKLNPIIKNSKITKIEDV